MITFYHSYQAIKKLAQRQGKTVQDMVNALIACWHNEQHRQEVERLNLEMGRKAAERQPEPAPKPTPKKRGRPAKTQPTEGKPKRTMSMEARRNVSRGMKLSWARRKLEQAGIR